MKKGHLHDNFYYKKSQPSDKSHQIISFCFKKSQTYRINYTTKQKLVKLNYQINKFIVKITKSKYLGQDTGDGLRPDHYHCV